MQILEGLDIINLQISSYLVVQPKQRKNVPLAVVRLIVREIQVELVVDGVDVLFACQLHGL